MDNKRKIPWKWIIPLAVIIIIALCLLIFRVEKVTVEGNTFFSEDVVASEVCGSFWDKNVISSFVKNRLGFTKELPYVRECEVTYPAHNEIHITLYEKTILAGICYMNQYIYFDKDGMVLRSTEEPIESVPIFQTNTMTTFSLYEKVKMEDEGALDQIMNLASLLQHYEITWDRVEFDDEDAAFLYTGDIKVSLGKRDNYDDQISDLASVLKTAKKKNLSGEIDMTNHNFKDDIILKQNK